MTITPGKNGHVRIEYDLDSVQTFTLTEEEHAQAMAMMAETLGYESVEALKASMKEAEKFWCKCGNPSKQTTYYDDYEGELCDKHHYTCDDCNLIFQVG